MKHSYRVDCTCARCEKECSRRNRQSTAAGTNWTHPKQYAGRREFKRRSRPIESRRPIHGSQEWAETRGDDIPSYDQPGDDYDNGI